MTASSVHEFEGRVFEELSEEIFVRCHVCILEYPDEMTRSAKIKIIALKPVPPASNKYLRLYAVWECMECRLYQNSR